MLSVTLMYPQDTPEAAPEITAVPEGGGQASVLEAAAEVLTVNLSSRIAFASLQFPDHTPRPIPSALAPDVETALLGCLSQVLLMLLTRVLNHGLTLDPLHLECCKVSLSSVVRSTSGPALS